MLRSRNTEWIENPTLSSFFSWISLLSICLDISLLDRGMKTTPVNQRNKPKGQANLSSSLATAVPFFSIGHRWNIPINNSNHNFWFHDRFWSFVTLFNTYTFILSKSRRGSKQIVWNHEKKYWKLREVYLPNFFQ